MTIESVILASSCFFIGTSSIYHAYLCANCDEYRIHKSYLKNSIEFNNISKSLIFGIIPAASIWIGYYSSPL